MNKYFLLSVNASVVAAVFLSAFSEQAYAQNSQRRIEQIKHTINTKFMVFNKIWQKQKWDAIKSIPL